VRRVVVGSECKAAAPSPTRQPASRPASQPASQPASAGGSLRAGASRWARVRSAALKWRGRATYL
jgi:hypothetical protein